MPGFIRRFGFFPGTETITQIEGVVIVDLPPPGTIEGIDTGVAALVGEFPNMTFGVAVDGAGAVTTLSAPQEIFSSKDLLDKLGGFDPTIGDFGNAEGNGFVSIRNKRFSRLIVAPINLASGFGGRYFRDLPLSTSATDTLPVVPVQGASIAAGREFQNSTGGRILAGAQINFTAFDAFYVATGGRTVAGGAAATQTFLAAEAAEQVWQANTAGTVFVDQTAAYNSVAVADFNPFLALGVIGDYVAFGMDATFSGLTMDNTGGTQGVAGVVVWEYWNGTTWTALAGISDGTSSFTAALAAGQVVSWTVPSDWATLALSGVTKFYVRANIAATVYTTSPVYDSGFVAGPDLSSIARPDGDRGLKKGDVVVIGNNSLGSPSPASEAGTYRINTDPPTGADTIILEKLDGTAFTFAANTNVPLRIHISSDADSAPPVVLGATGAGGYNATEGGGYSVPLRPLTDATGDGATDGSYPLGQILPPIINPPAITGDTANPLSGLSSRLHPTSAVAYTKAIQGLNAPNDATLDAAYSTALDALISDLVPVASINMIWSARTSATIRNLVTAHVGTASATSLGRMGVIRPELSVQTTSEAVSDTDPGVGANRIERIVYAWPGARMFVAEAVGTRLKLADGLTTFDGVLDVAWDSYVISLMSNLPPERNIGQAARPVPALLATIRGVQRGVTKLELNDYITLRARGVAALRIDRTVGPICQSGITTSLIAGEKNIARRRMADFIQDSISRRLVQFVKLPLTLANKDSAVVEVDAFLRELLSEDNPPAQRISGFDLDDVSGNTPTLEAKGIFVIIVRVRTLASGDFIVLQTEIGENVTFAQTTA